MGIQPIGMFMTKEDQERFDAWSKEDIYEAYIVEQKERKRLNTEVNKLGRKIAEIRFMASNK